MNCEVNIDNNKKKLKLYYGLLITVLCIIGVSFAWFRLYLSQTENNTIASRTCFNTTLTEDTSKISLTDAFPITDEDGLKQTPFTFTIKNNCNSYVKVYITIDSTYRESTDTSYLKDNYMKVNISPKGTTTSKSVILGSQTLTDLENNKKGYTKNYIANRFLTVLSNFYNKLGVTDMETCYKAFKKEVFKKIKIEEKKFGMEPEITAKVAKYKFRFLEVPISYYPRTIEEGKKINFKDGIEAIKCIRKYNKK